MVDIEKTEKAIRDLLLAIGEDPDRPGLVETPKRCAKMYAELLAGMDSDAQEHLSKQFDVPHSEFLLEKDIPFYSLCEHHLLPFFGKAHIAYIPSDNKIIGLSKINRIVQFFGRRPQVQERLTQQIFVALQTLLNTRNVAVSITAVHYCVKARGVKDPTSCTTTTALGGHFKNNPSSRHEFLTD